MKIFKRVIQYFICVIVSSLTFFIFELIGIKSGGLVDGINPIIIISSGLGIGWVVFQIIFFNMKQIKRDGGLDFLTWIKITLESSGILFASLFLFMWIFK